MRSTLYGLVYQDSDLCSTCIGSVGECVLLGFMSMAPAGLEIRVSVCHQHRAPRAIGPDEVCDCGHIGWRHLSGGCAGSFDWATRVHVPCACTRFRPAEGWNLRPGVDSPIAPHRKGCALQLVRRGSDAMTEVSNGKRK